ncbi:hypothetical protein HanXRQr2_Chr05g0194771 [Helianthus annuus]|uniref:Uncharacterized protein n=1 Tax=Helianthus annuus TaxID=4232 RepID=A0A251UKM5_HELAN|nr:hypothetical protein HanXRQr2_Chr05g0194771 [Helianthus annuus]
MIHLQHFGSKFVSIYKHITRRISSVPSLFLSQLGFHKFLSHARVSQENPR